MINKELFIRKLSANTDKSLRECKEITEAFIKTMQDAVIEDGGVDFYGFMRIEKAVQPARERINPTTREKFVSPEKFVPKAKFSSRFKEAVKG